MPFWMTLLVGSSLALLLVLACVRAIKTKSSGLFVVETFLLVGLAVFFNRLFGFPIPRSTVAKSASSDLAVAAALFVCMVLGMLAQFLFDRFTVPAKNRNTFDWGIFVAPFFASPIVFIPLLAALQNADVDLTRLTTPRLMVFLVAFENGFFWKEFFDQRRKGAKQREAQ